MLGKRIGLICAVLFTGLATTARAHDPFSSSATALIGPTGLELTVTLAQSAARDLVERTAATPDEPITEESFGRFRERLQQVAPTLYTIESNGVALAGSGARLELTGENDVEFRIHYPTPAIGRLRFRGTYLVKMTDGHVATLYIENSRRDDLGWGYLEMLNPALEISVPADAIKAVAEGQTAAPAEPPVRPVSPPFRAFLKLGIEHILTGYDHLLFLAGLIIACRRFATMAGIITCFTLAHSITLALAALEIVSIPSRVVEPLIAASIVFVGVENLVRRGEEPKGRWALTFVFGLMHGFGFASALKGIGLGVGGASLIPPLFSFNLGVEIGQITVAAIFLPLLFQLRRFPTFVRYGVPAASVVVTLLGTYWLLQRTVFS